MSGFWTALKWTARILAGLFVAFHLYALALIWLPVPGTILMMQRALQGHDVRRDAVPLSDISPHLVRAVIAHRARSRVARSSSSESQQVAC